jgi:hypothetical protein
MEGIMSNPSGDYSFAGLGFTGLRFSQDGTKYTGGLFSAKGTTPISGGTYTDATGVVTFNVAESPAGVTDLSFTGNIILDLTGNVIAIAGTWTGRSLITVLPGTTSSAASAPVQADARRIGPIGPILQVHGAWAAYNRQNTI